MMARIDSKHWIQAVSDGPSLFTDRHILLSLKFLSTSSGISVSQVLVRPRWILLSSTSSYTFLQINERVNVWMFGTTSSEIGPSQYYSFSGHILVLPSSISSQIFRLPFGPLDSLQFLFASTRLDEIELVDDLWHDYQEVA